MSVYITEIVPAEMPHVVPQTQTLHWLMARVLRRWDGQPNKAAARALNLYERLLGNDRIKTRHVVLPDVLHTDWERMELYGKPTPTQADRMRVFERAADALAVQLYPKAPTMKYLIQVSCTGYTSPNAVQKLVSATESSARCWHLGHMGCYASVPAIHMASQLDGPSSLFFVELCSLHLDVDGTSATQVVVNSLFADGAVRVDVSTERPTNGFRWIGSAERIFANSLEDMTWRLGENSFEMTLNRNVPKTILSNLKEFVRIFLQEHEMSLSEISHFAIHPGGPRIVESVSEALGLPDSAIVHSESVLQHRGNISSCSLPHIWSSLLQDPSVTSGQRVLSLAFGPGLTFAAALTERV